MHWYWSSHALVCLALDHITHSPRSCHNHHWSVAVHWYWSSHALVCLLLDHTTQSPRSYHTVTVGLWSCIGNGIDLVTHWSVFSQMPWPTKIILHSHLWSSHALVWDCFLTDAFVSSGWRSQWWFIYLYENLTISIVFWSANPLASIISLMMHHYKSECEKGGLFVQYESCTTCV